MGTIHKSRATRRSAGTTSKPLLHGEPRWLDRVSGRVHDSSGCLRSLTHQPKKKCAENRYRTHRTEDLPTQKALASGPFSQGIRKHGSISKIQYISCWPSTLIRFHLRGNTLPAFCPTHCCYNPGVDPRALLA